MGLSPMLRMQVLQQCLCFSDEGTPIFRTGVPWRYFDVRVLVFYLNLL